MLCKRIVYRVIEFSKRWGPAFLGTFVASVVGIVPALIYLSGATRAAIVSVLSLLAVVLGIASAVAIRFDLKDARKRDSDEKNRKTNTKFRVSRL